MSKKMRIRLWALATFAVGAFGAIGTGWPSGPRRTAATSDPANYLYWVEYMYQEHTMVWSGFFSNVPQRHPGPVLFVILYLGRFVAGFVGAADVDIYISATFSITCLLLVAASAWLVSRAYKSPAAGAGLVITYCWLILNVDPRSWAKLYSGLRIYPIYGPYLAAHLALACGAGLLAIAGRDRRAVSWTILFGGLLFQSFVETAPYGLLIALFALGVEIARRKNKTVAAWFEQRDDTSDGHRRPKRTWAPLLAVVIGFGPFAMRMATEGVDLPLRYIEGIRTAQANTTHPVARWPYGFSAPLGTGNYTAWVLAAMVVAVVATGMRRTWRHQAAMAAGIYLAIVLYVIFVVRRHLPQASPVAALPPLMFAPTLALVNKKFLTPLCAATTILVAWASFTTFNPLDKPSASLSGSPGPVALADAVQARTEPGSVIGFLSTTGQRDLSNEAIDIAWGTMLELYRRGLRPCLPGSSGPEPPVAYCLYNKNGDTRYSAADTDSVVDAWVVFDHNPKVGAPEPIATMPGFAIYLVDSPKQVGLIPCREPMTWGPPELFSNETELYSSYERCLPR